MTQPENSWKKPSAACGLIHSAARPVPATRAAFAAIATGTASTARTTRAQSRGSVSFPRTIASVSSETSERMPLHASTTSSVVVGSTRMLPSRSTGTPLADSTASPALDASNCSGNAS